MVFGDSFLMLDVAVDRLLTEEVAVELAFSSEMLLSNPFLVCLLMKPKETTDYLPADLVLTIRICLVFKFKLD